MAFIGVWAFGRHLDVGAADLMLREKMEISIFALVASLQSGTGNKSGWSLNRKTTRPGRDGR
jgi:hypothetical protein